MINTALQTADQSQDFPVALVPRINIHTFCDNQQTAETLQASAMDRRMAKAHVTIQLGGILAAVQVYQSQPTPNVLVVESHSTRDGILSELAQLAHVCQPTTKVIVVGHLNDVILYRELIRQGVSEYLVAPIGQMQMIETIAGLYRDPKAAPLGRILAFVGAKGGVGSSTIAHNVAWMMSKNHDLETIITDLDLAFGTAGLNFNQDAAGFCRGIAQRLGAGLDAQRARCPALVQAGGGVAHDDVDLVEAEIEFFGHDLRDRDFQPLPEVDLAEIRRRAAVGMDRNPGIQLLGRESRFAGGDRLRPGCSGGPRDGGPDDQRTGGQEKFAAVRRRGGEMVHVPAFHAIRACTRLIARRIATCAPQRHLRPASASRICASLAAGFFLRNAAVVITQPLMQ